MFQNIDILRQSMAFMTQAGARQGVIAENIANADTPGYRAKDVETFQARMGGLSPKTTRPSHIITQTGGEGRLVHAHMKGTAKPNGNDVSIEEEMARAVTAKRDHDRGIAIYRHSLKILRSAIGKG